MDAETLSLLHRTIDRVTADYTALRFNTAVARLTELNNRLTALAASGPLPRSLVEPMVLLAAPLVPHVAEELWSRLGHTESLAYQPFPVADPARMVAETVLYPVQVNGKLRGKIEVPADAEAAAIEAAALDRVAPSLDGRVPKRVIVVPGRIVTVVGVGRSGCGSPPGTSTPPRSGSPGCCPGWTSGPRTWCACRRPSSPTPSSPPSSTPCWPSGGTRSRTTARAGGTGWPCCPGSGWRTSSAGFPDAPRYPDDTAEPEARALTATCGGLRVTSVYVPNGRTPDDPHYAYKLRWLDKLRETVAGG